MNLTQLLYWIASMDINLWVEKDHLRYRAPKGTMSDDIIRELTEHKLELIDLLSKKSQESDSISNANIFTQVMERDNLWGCSQYLGTPSSHAAASPNEIHNSPFLKWERRSLLSLFTSGEITPVDAADISYIAISHTLHSQIGVNGIRIIRGWFKNLPLLARISETSLGRIASIVLPKFDFELYGDQKELVKAIVGGLEIAKQLGARVTSLTGLLPSATNYGFAVKDAIIDRRDLPKISTGHATTVSAVLFMIQRLLQESGRDIAQEQVAFIGMGSIGRAVLRLLLRCLPHPNIILLSDLFSKKNYLREIKDDILQNYRFCGSVEIVNAETALCNATLIIGATNVPEILDIKKLQPGCMIVDDSAPHCFNVEQAIRRFEEYEDILFTEGGVLNSPNPINELRYMPYQLESFKNIQDSIISKNWGEIAPVLYFRV